MAACRCRGSRTKTMPLSYGTLSHLWASVAHESASAKPFTRCARAGAAAAQSPKAPSTWTQAPASLARGMISAAGSNAPVLTSPACRHTIVSASSRGIASLRILPWPSTGALITRSRPRPSSVNALRTLTWTCSLTTTVIGGAPNRPRVSTSHPRRASLPGRPKLTRRGGGGLRVGRRLWKRLVYPPQVGKCLRRGRDGSVVQAPAIAPSTLGSVLQQVFHNVSSRGASRPGARRRLRPGQPHGERAARAWGARDRDVATLQLGQEPRDREAEPASPQVAAARLIHTEEAVEDPLYVLRRDARPRVAHAHTHHRAVGFERERDAAGGGRVADGVGGEVQQDMTRAIGVAQRPARRQRGGMHGEISSQRHRLGNLPHLVHHCREVEGRVGER